MESRKDRTTNGRRSLLSVIVTAVAITINHWYVLGAGALWLGAGLTIVPVGLWWWHARTQSRVAAVGYLAMNAWIVVGFGLMKGFWQGALRLFLGTFLASRWSAFPKPVIGRVPFEMSGLVMFVGSLFVLYYACRLVMAEHRPEAMRQRTAIGSVVTAAVAASAVAISVWTASDRDRWVPPSNGLVKIGIIVPTTGPYAILGNSFVKAAQMGLDDLSNTTYQYQLVVRDSGPDPAAARAVIRRVVYDDRVKAIVGGVSLIGQVTKPIATQARIPHACVCTVASIADGAYNFTNIPSPEAEATMWVREAKRRGITRVAILSQEYPSINNHVRALKTEAARAGVQVSFEQRFEESATDYRALIQRAEATAPDVLYIEAFNPALDRLAQQLADAGVHHLSSVVAPSVSERPDLFEGVWYTDSNLREFAFKQRFEAKYPGTPFATHMMPYAYDSVQMIAQAFERGENPAVYLRNLREYEGTAGPLVKAPGKGHFESAPTVWMIKNGKPALVAQVHAHEEERP